MKLYEVIAAACDYDEYDAFVIWANTPEEALDIAKKKATDGYRFGYGENFEIGATVREVVKPKAPGILLGSFNAG